MDTSQLSLVLLSLCALSAATPTPGQFLSEDDVRDIMFKLSVPYSENKMKVVHFYETISEKMLHFMEEVPARLEKVHEGMKQAIHAGVDKMNNGRAMLSEVEHQADEIIAMMAEQRQACSSNQWTIRQSHGDHPVSAPAGHHSAVELPHSTADSHSEWAELLHVSDSELREVMKPTTGVAQLAQDILSQYHQEQYVSLEDVLNVMQAVAHQLEADTLEAMPARLGRVETAARYLAQSFHHVMGIASTVETLRSLADQATSEHITAVQRKVEIISHVLENVECSA